MTMKFANSAGQSWGGGLYVVHVSTVYISGEYTPVRRRVSHVICWEENEPERLSSASWRLPWRHRSHLSVMTSTHVCIVTDIIVHNHEMMMSWCAQSHRMLRATLLFIPLLGICLVGARVLEIVPSLAKQFLLPVGKNNAESSPWKESIFHSHTHLHIKWDRLETRGLGHEKHK